MNFDLERFVEAQDPVYGQVCRELRQGRKQGHWIWFIFPQLKGLGQSLMANKFGISSADEAKAYLAHPILGPRLAECTSLVNCVEGVSIGEIFGCPDTLKFRSSMTLFVHVSSGSNVFADALEKYYAGQPDPLTLEMLNGQQVIAPPAHHSASPQSRIHSKLRNVSATRELKMNTSLFSGVV